jgi:hypothetical protein
MFDNWKKISDKTTREIYNPLRKILLDVIALASFQSGRFYFTLDPIRHIFLTSEGAGASSDSRARMIVNLPAVRSRAAMP